MASAGGKLTLYGKPASVDEIRAHAETLADQRDADAIKSGLARATAPLDNMDAEDECTA